MQTKTLLFLLASMLFTINLLAQDGIKPIIDVHVHGYSKEIYRPRPEKRGMKSPKTYEAFRKETMAAFKKYNVVKAVVSAPGGNHDFDDDKRLIFGYSTDAPPPIEDTVEFKRKIEAGEIKVFGEIGAVYAGYTLSDPAFDPFLAICDRYDIPVAIHTGGGPTNPHKRGNTTFRLQLGHPYTIEDVIHKYPNLRIYMMHAGASYHDEAIQLMLQYSHIYADLGVVLWVGLPAIDDGEAFLRKAKRYNLIDRVLFGSDQMTWPGAVGMSIQKLDSYDFLTEEDKRKIFYENAVRFLKLTEEDLKGN